MKKSIFFFCFFLLTTLFLTHCVRTTPVKEEIHPSETTVNEIIEKPTQREERQPSVEDAGDVEDVAYVQEHPPEKSPTFSLQQLLQRKSKQSIRIVSYNIERDSVFQEKDPRQPKFIRLIKAIQADIWALQEVTSSTSQVVTFFNTHLPQGLGKTWHANFAGGTMTVSKFPFLNHHYKTEPFSGRKVSLSLLDLPNASFSKDIYIMNNHFTCCGGNDGKRQNEADQIVNWIRYLRRKEQGPIEIPENTPFVILGDLNLVESNQPLKTLLTGDIIDEATFGKDIKPDWDDTNLTNANPSHNGLQQKFYTWRWDTGPYGPSQIDFVLFSDSVLSLEHKFILNTTTIDPTQLKTAGLEQLDSAKTRTITGQYNFDHLPLITDFKIK